MNKLTKTAIYGTALVVIGGAIWQIIEKLRNK